MRVMRKSALNRIGLLGSAAALAMVGLASGAQAYQTKFGELEIVFDTTISVGSSMRVADRNAGLLPEANGGNIDPRDNVALGAVILAPHANGFGAGDPSPLIANYGDLNLTNNGFNHDGSTNGDDGRMNFDKGDLIGGNVKASHDLQIKWQNLTFFARGVGFYDAVLNDPNVGEHSQLTDQARGDVGRNYELLDAYISGDFDILGLPTNLRVGKQVISWGESTFILNGMNVFNPIDVGAFRRPGSEIKEALVPVNAVFGSVSLPFNVSLAGYYALDWEPFEIDPAGTPFSTQDSVTSGGGIGGNRGFGHITGSPFTGNRRNCDRLAPFVAGPATFINGTTYVQDTFLGGDPTAGGLLNNGRLDCSDVASAGLTGVFTNTVAYNTPYPIGFHELVRYGLVDALGADDGMTRRTQQALGRGEADYAKDDGQYGISMRYLAEWLDGAEFTFSYQNYHSRLPILGIRKASSEADLSFFTNGTSINTSGVSTRLLPLAGRFAVAANAPTFFGSRAGAFTVANGVLGSLGPVTPLGTNAASQMARTAVNDPSGMLAGFVAALAANGWGGLTVVDHLANGYKNQHAVMVLNTVLAWEQGSSSSPSGQPQTFNGAELLNVSTDGETFLTYAEDIELWGASFSSTILGWGVQGEATYRPNAPFQADTDALTIQSLVSNCIFHTLFGAAAGTVAAGQTPDGSGNFGVCGLDQQATNPVIRNQMYTAQIGTTATFTASEPIIEMLGADLGILLTEFGVVHVPDVEDTWISTNAANFLKPQYQNTGCQGTELPLGGILDLDGKTSKQCRPTDTSAGYVLVGVLQYNNAFGTGYLLSPLIAFSHDFYGTTPSPYGNYVEDRMSVSTQVSATLNNNFRLNLGYTNFFGGHINNKSQDQDFASFSASYSF
jgi:hypothetical protein